MSQTSTIAFALLVGFIVFITIKGELPSYLGVIGLAGSSATPPSSATPASTGSGSPNNNVLGLPSLPSLPSLGSSPGVYV